MSLIYLVLGIFIVMVLVNSKLRNRVKGWFFRKSDDAADLFGDIVDDRDQKIKGGRKSEHELKKQRVEIVATIKSLQREILTEEANIDKHTELAKLAKDNDNVPAALKFLENVELNESKIAALVNALEQAETMDLNIQEELTQIDNTLDKAESDQELFKVEHRTAKIKETLRGSNGFGGIGNLDFSEEDQELDKLKAKNDAHDIVFAKKDSVTADFEEQLKEKALKERLESL